MEYFRKSGSFGTVLPMHWTTSQSQPEGTTDTTEKPIRKGSLFRGLTRIDTILQRHPFDALVMSPAGTTSSPVKAGDIDDTFDQMIPERGKKKITEKQKLEGKPLIEEESPGEGSVCWDSVPSIAMAHVMVPALGITGPVEPLPAFWPSMDLPCALRDLHDHPPHSQNYPTLWTSPYHVDNVTIVEQQFMVDLTPAGNPNKPDHHSERSRLLMHRFARQGKLEDLEEAIKNQQSAIVLTPTGDPSKPERQTGLSYLLVLSFQSSGRFEDLDEAIKIQQSAAVLTPAGDPNKPDRQSMLSRLLMHRFERHGKLEDLEEAIKNQQSAAVLTPTGDQFQSARLSYLGILLERRVQTAGDRNSEIGSSPRVSVGASTMPEGARTIYEIVKDKLFEDLQQLGICIKRSKRRELDTTISRMESAIMCLKLQDGDKLCQDIFKASTRLGAYCQALRNRASDESNQEELEDLYKEFVRIEREFSAAHDLSRSKYEQLYKQWKTERQSISKFLSKADSSKSQSDSQEVLALVKQVDAGFEKMDDVLKKEATDLKRLSEALNGLSKLVHLSSDPPITSDDPAQISPQPPHPPSTPSDLLKQVDDSIETFSRVDQLVEKSRYTKAREAVSKMSSKTMQRLKKLRTSSEHYDQEIQSFTRLRTRRNDNSRDIWNRQLVLCEQLSALVGGMRQMLEAIENGFSGCKASIQGLVFSSLGDLLCDLEPYLPQAGLEVISKGLHPDLILYEAAFQAIAASISAQSEPLEGIKGSLSVLDKLRGV